MPNRNNCNETDFAKAVPKLNCGSISKANPFLAASYNNSLHWDCANLDSTSNPVASGTFVITPESYDIIPNDTDGLAILTDYVGPNSTPVYWAWNGFSLSKFIIDADRVKLHEIDRIYISTTPPHYKTVGTLKAGYIKLGMFNNF